MTTIDQLKARLKTDTRIILAGLGIPFDEKSHKFHCPICKPTASSTHGGSMGERNGAIKCFRCSGGKNGKGWDAIGLVMEMKGIGFKEACEVVNDILGVAKIEGSDIAKRVGKLPKVKPRKEFESRLECISCLDFVMRKDGMNFTNSWIYTDREGIPVGYVHRYDNEDKTRKDYRPTALLKNGKWVIGKPDQKWPLYNLPAIISSFDSSIFLVEGEKCVDACTDIGLLATTSAGGANGTVNTDFTPLAGRNVILIPDDDAPLTGKDGKPLLVDGKKQYAGENYIHAVKKELDILTPKPKVWVMRLTNRESGDDIYDWLEERKDLTKEEKVGQLRELWKKRSKI